MSDDSSAVLSSCLSDFPAADIVLLLEGLEGAIDCLTPALGAAMFSSLRTSLIGEDVVSLESLEGPIGRFMPVFTRVREPNAVLASAVAPPALRSEHNPAKNAFSPLPAPMLFAVRLDAEGALPGELAFAGRSVETLPGLFLGLFSALARKLASFSDPSTRFDMSDSPATRNDSSAVFSSSFLAILRRGDSEGLRAESGDLRRGDSEGLRGELGRVAGFDPTALDGLLLRSTEPIDLHFEGLSSDMSSKEVALPTSMADRFSDRAVQREWLSMRENTFSAIYVDSLTSPVLLGLISSARVFSGCMLLSVTVPADEADLMLSDEVAREDIELGL